ncbi:hypothetical protein PMAYCL1PPCAC_32379, partial [Pristionchus mayeri]
RSSSPTRTPRRSTTRSRRSRPASPLLSAPRSRPTRPSSHTRSVSSPCTRSSSVSKSLSPTSRRIPTRLRPEFSSSPLQRRSPLEISSSFSAPERHPRRSTRRSRRSRPAFPPMSLERSTLTRPKSRLRSVSSLFTTTKLRPVAVNIY